MEHALSDAGLALADVTLTRQELQRDGGRNCYEIEFVSETHVYEYEIDAATGEVRGVSIHALGTEGAAASASQGQTGMGQPDAENGQSEPSGPAGSVRAAVPVGGRPAGSVRAAAWHGGRPVPVGGRPAGSVRAAAPDSRADESAVPASRGGGDH